MRKLVLLVLVATLAGTVSASADVITWTNTGNGNWSVAANWSPNQVPSTNDMVIITNNGIYTVTLNINPTIAGLWLGGSSGTQTLATAGRTLTLNGDATVGTNGVIIFSGGILSGYSRMDLRGTITWNSGTLDTNSVLNVATSGLITLSSGSSKYWYGNLTNAGTVEWQPTGGIVMYGKFHNLATGLFDAQVDGGSILVSGTNATFINDGLFRKTNGTGNINFYPSLINNGTVDIQAGTLNLRAPSAFNSGCTFTGGGTVNFLVGTNTLNGDIYSENLTLLYSATLTGTGSISGTLRWESGAIGEDAAITVATNGRITLATTSGKGWYGRVTNAGIIDWQLNSGITMSGALHNLAGGTFDMLLDGGSILMQGTNATIINDGFIRRTNGTGTITFYVPLINNGSVDVQTGTLTLRGNSVFNSGCEFTGAGIVSLPVGTNTFNGSIYSENLVLGSTLAGSCELSGTMTWGAGTIDTNASLTIATNGQLLIGSTAQFAKFLDGSLTNAGTIVWKPLGNLLLGRTLHNLSNAVFDIQTVNSIVASETNAVFINEGTLRRSGEAGGTTCYVPLINNGTVDVQSGTLELRGGGVWNDGSEFTGAGLIRIPTGTNRLNGTIYSENLELAGTTLVSSGLLTGTFSWTDGTIDAVLPFNITSNSVLTIGNGFNNTKFLNGNLTNAGTITWLTGGSLQLGGVFHNLAGGLFDIHGDILLGSNALTSLVINDGIVQKSAGNGTATCWPRLINDGVLEINSGKLSCVGGLSNPTGTISLAGGTFQNNEPINMAGGLLTGWGSVYASVINSATVRPSSTNGVLTITGNYVQTLAGTTAFELGGNQPGTNQSRLIITGSVSLSGCINVELSDGYLPEPDTNFMVMTFGSHAGEFDCQNGFIILGEARRLTPLYAPTSLTLSAVAAPEPTEIPLSVTVKEGSALVAWPLEFTGYELYWSTNLSQTNWTLLPSVTNRWIESPPLAPEKFFKLEEL
jgi:hypothetical protein